MSPLHAARLPSLRLTARATVLAAAVITAVAGLAGTAAAGTASPSATSASSSAPAVSRAAATGGGIVLTNFNPSGQQVIRFDTDGNAVDAHDGQIAYFDHTYYLYGTSYNCGYQWGVNSDFCGFKVYSSPDLVHWTDDGYVVLPYLCGDCFRPHVLYDRFTRRFVLWTNDSSAPDDFRVYTSATPTGVFTQQATPALAVSCGWDFALFTHPVSGRGYIVHTQNCDSDTAILVVEQLTRNDLTSDGTWAPAAGNPVSALEAPAMFYRDGTYYITASDPTCGYCTGTGTGYVTAPSPLGPWTGQSTFGWSVQDGHLLVNGDGIGLAKAGADWTDYTFSADVTPLGTGRAGSISYAQAGMVFRFDAAGNGYAFLLSNYPYTSPAAPGYVVFVPFAGGNNGAIQPVALPFAVTAGQTYHVAIGVSGSTFTITVNGTLADTVTDSSYASGTVGFREDTPDHESAQFSNVEVTAPDGSVLLADDFTDGLSQWAASGWGVPTLISPDSCGGQPSFVAPLPARGGGTVYLYGSDLWQGKHNEGLANYYWAPLQFSSGGGIEPITCQPTVSVPLAVSAGGHQAAAPGLDQSSGVSGFSATCEVAGQDEAMQTFTAGRTGTLKQVRFTAFQSSTTQDVSSPVYEPDEPLTLRLVTLSSSGGIGQVLAQQTYATTAVSFSARNLVMAPGVPVTSGQTYAVVASSDTTQGCYGVASSAANPYPGGSAAFSTDGGQMFTAAPGTDLKFLTVVQPSDAEGTQRQ
jgi:hypothetical protein